MHSCLTFVLFINISLKNEKFVIYKLICEIVGKRYSHLNILSTLAYVWIVYVYKFVLISLDDFRYNCSIINCILANLSPDVVKKLPDELQTGIYFGWANVDNGEIYKAVLSLGWNPFFKNKEKSLVSTRGQLQKRKKYS